MIEDLSWLVIILRSNIEVNLCSHPRIRLIESDNLPQLSRVKIRLFSISISFIIFFSFFSFFFLVVVGGGGWLQRVSTYTKDVILINAILKSVHYCRAGKEWVDWTELPLKLDEEKSGAWFHIVLTMTCPISTRGIFSSRQF